jgi:acetolactate synthase-1/2/3 large subunit
VRWGIASVTVVNNNGGGNQSKRGFDRAYGGEQTAKARELWTYRMVDFARLATDIGAFGVRVERPGDFASALEQAIRSGRPAIVDVVTDIEAIAPLAVTG